MSVLLCLLLNYSALGYYKCYCPNNIIMTKETQRYIYPLYIDPSKIKHNNLA